MNKGIVGLMMCACIILGGTVVYLQAKEDKKPPTIQFQENDAAYKAGDDYNNLLAGVTAFDDQDGDVTDTLVVESVYPEKDQKKATVIYVARDKSNNIRKVNRKVVYNESEQIAPYDDIVDVNDEDVEPVKAVTKPDEKKPVVEQEEEGEEAQDGKPKIMLTTDQVSIKAGDSVNRITFVDSITDDKDDTDQLWESIRIVGDEFDNDVPGVYEQIYYVVDSDGNKSNEATLTITVE